MSGKKLTHEERAERYLNAPVEEVLFLDTPAVKSLLTSCPTIDIKKARNACFDVLSLAHKRELQCREDLVNYTSIVKAALGVDWYYYNPDSDEDEDEEEVVKAPVVEKTCINCKHLNTLTMICKKKKMQVKNNQLCSDDSFDKA